MTRRERLMATLQGKPVDRPAVSFYEIGGFRIDTADPDPYNVYNSPAWNPLIELAEEQTDIIRMMSPVRERSIDPTGSAGGAGWREYFREETSDDGETRVTRTELTVAGRTMTQVTKRERQINTVWTVEHLLKDADDLEAYLAIPDEVFEEKIDTAPLEAEEAALGENGIVMVDTEDPLCAAAALFSMEDYSVLAFTEEELFHRLLEKMARRIQARTAEVSRLFPGRLWRIYGPEYASEPYLPPRLFDDYVVRYDEPMIKAIQAHGGYARVHCHGRLKNILDSIAGMGADALDPIEPPPQGDMELREVRQRHGRQLVLFGNLEIADIEMLPPDRFAEKVKCALEEGTAGEGRGFVLLPSASPYGRELSPVALRNYQTMVQLAQTW
ncbi:MAG: uroporphyrinogen decarboxylase family protein [Verrucomicrobiota bacterium]